jgi:hypothetical protein
MATRKTTVSSSTRFDDHSYPTILQLDGSPKKRKPAAHLDDGNLSAAAASGSGVKKRHSCIKTTSTNNDAGTDHVLAAKNKLL